MILDIVADKAVDTDKKQNIRADKKLIAAIKKIVNNDKEQNMTAEPFILIKY